jgi:hypothetical protein
VAQGMHHVTCRDAPFRSIHRPISQTSTTIDAPLRAASAPWKRPTSGRPHIPIEHANSHVQRIAPVGVHPVTMIMCTPAIWACKPTASLGASVPSAAGKQWNLHMERRSLGGAAHPPSHCPVRRRLCQAEGTRLAPKKG